MPKYNVKVCRESVRTTYIKVEAEDYQSAVDKALAQAKDIDFNINGTGTGKPHHYAEDVKREEL